uniref:Si:ch211-10a23.2 n=1 Tax=Cyprinus carpio carpio TaxID=630221 RepID=A0A8C1FPP8_CYPCA
MRRAFTAVTMSQLYRGLNRFNVSSSHRSKRKHGCQQRTLDIELILNARKHPFNCNTTMVVLVACPSKGEGDEEIEGDVGLELKVNFSEKAVLRNARLSGKWGASETALSFFPFAPGEPFKMEIVCEHQQFRILVDGQPLCGFTHRLTQLASLTALRVHGDLQLTKVA